MADMTAHRHSRRHATSGAEPRTYPWPLLLIAAPAAVAIWSGWVGLGGMCGFGLVYPLPGIVPWLHVNTAITLPVGVEAYGAYALGTLAEPRLPGPCPAVCQVVRAWRARLRNARPGGISPAYRRALRAGTVACRRGRVLHAGDHARLRCRADPPAAR